MSHILGKTNDSIRNSSQTQNWFETRTGSPKGLLNLLAGGVSGLVKPASNQTLPSNRTVIVLAFVSLVAILASGYLGWIAVTSSKIVGCGGGRIFNCGHVISSRWSLWLGIPVSLLAIGLYAGLAGALTVGASSRVSFRTRQIGWNAVTVLAITAGLAAIWFLSLQIFVLNHLCTYCLVAHACGLIASVVVVRVNPTGHVAASALAMTGLSLLIGGQLLGIQPETFKIEKYELPANSPEVFEFEAPIANPKLENNSGSSPAGLNNLVSSIFNSAIFQAAQVLVLMPQANQQQSSAQQNPKQSDLASATTDTANQQEKTASQPVTRRMVSINGGTIQLDVGQWPIVGSQKAKYVFVEMFDYACPHCRRTHAAIKQASQLLGGDLAVVVLPIPLNAACNPAIFVTHPKFNESCEIAKLSVAVWRVAPEKFSDFHDWMLSTERCPSFAEAKSKADEMVDSKRLDAEIGSTLPAQYIAKTVELYKRAGSGNVPKLIFPSTSIIGELTSGERLVEIIKQQIN